VLELELLYRVDWKIVPCPEVLVDYYCSLVGRADGYGYGFRKQCSPDGERGVMHSAARGDSD
jgi:hypothetical protein